MTSLLRQIGAGVLFCICGFTVARASHLAGGELTYRYTGDSAGLHKYIITLTLYQDCFAGNPESLMQDNPAFLAIYPNNLSTTPLLTDINFFYSSSVSVPVDLNTDCGALATNLTTCLLKKTFVKTYYLPHDPAGYVVAYQRCCRSSAIANIKNPGGIGTTYYCIIPPGTVTNNSAVFKKDPPQVVCLGWPLKYDHSATDADGDSLSYEFCSALKGGSDADVKPTPPPPPYDSVIYMPPYSSHQQLPGSAVITIDAATGLITGIPNKAGKYQVTICCKEWRNGVLINTVTREFSCIVSPCVSGSAHFQPNANEDTTILAGQRVHFHASGGSTYFWTPGTFLSDTTISNPIGYFTAPGSYTYIVTAISDTGCSASDTVTVRVLDHSGFAVPNAFSPNGDNLNDILKPLPVKGSTLIRFRVFNRWGNMMYNGGPSNAGWDGTYKGTPQGIGVYFWHLEYVDTYGDTHSMKGNVTLIR